MRLVPSLLVLCLIAAAGPAMANRPEAAPTVPYYGLLENHPDGPEKAAAPGPWLDEPLVGLAQIMADHTGFEKVHIPNDVFAFFDKGKPAQRVLVTILEPEKSARQKMLADPDPVAREEVRRMVAERISPVIEDLEAIPGFELERQYDNFPVFAARVDLGAIVALMEDPRVEIIEKIGFSERHTAQGIPMMNATTPRSQWNGSGITIAVIDGGTDYMHPALGGGPVPNGKVQRGWDFVNNQPDFLMPNSTHGTAVAGVAAGLNTNQGDFIGGVATGAKIAGLNVFPDGPGPADDSYVIAALDWTVNNQYGDPQNPILVVNMSLGSPSFMEGFCDTLKPAYTSALNAVFSAGMMTVASAGNEGFCFSIGYPACVASTVAVGAVYDANIGSQAWCLNFFSCLNIGMQCGNTEPPGALHFDQTTAGKMVTGYSNSGPALHIFAPSNDAQAPLTGGGYWEDFGGTSTAAPYTSGAVAVLQHSAKATRGRYLPPVEAFNILNGTGEFITDWKSPTISRRLVNLSGMIGLLESLPPAPSNDNFPGQRLQGYTGAVQGTTANATREMGEPAHTGQDQSGSVWYTWTAPAAGQTTISTCQAASFDTVLSVYTGNTVGNLFLLVENDDDCGVRSRVQFNAVAGATYRIAVAGFGTESGTFTLDWQGQPGPIGRAIGDFNNDGCVNFQDFLFLLENWGQSVQGADMGFNDFMTLLEHWGSGC